MDLVFLVFIAITGVIVFLAAQQAKIKKQIEEERRKRGDDSLPSYAGSDPMMTGLPPDASPGAPPHHLPDAGGQHGGHDAGGSHGGHSGGFDGGSGDGGGGGHH